MRHGWNLIVFGSALLLGVLVSTPQMLHMLDARYQGIPVHLNTDEFHYLARIQEVLLGRENELGAAFTGGKDEPLLQPALIEKIEGRIFRPFGWNAQMVHTVMDFVAPFLLFLVLVGFLRACDLSRTQSLVAAVLFSFLQLYNLGRPIQQREGVLLSILALWGLIEGMERKIVWGIFGGILMGLLVDTSFWMWTFVWAWWGVAMLLVLWDWWRHRRNNDKERFSRIWKWFLFGGIAFVVASPFFWHTHQLSQLPLFDEVLFRSGLKHVYVLEAPPRSALFLLMAVGMFFLWARRKQWGGAYLVCTVVTAFIVLNQQFIHGVLFLFSSHYLMFFVLAGITALICGWQYFCENRMHRDGKICSAIIMLSALIFLSGIAYDNRYIIKQWRVENSDFGGQHLVSVLPVLLRMDRAVILSDTWTSGFIASYTHHDVVSSHFIHHNYHGHRALAERYCLTQAFVPRSERRIQEEPVLVFGGAYGPIYNAEERARLRGEEEKLVSDVCEDMDKNLRAFLAKYHVQYVLWNERIHPHWQMGRLTQKISEDEGWSLWKVMP